MSNTTLRKNQKNQGELSQHFIGTPSLFLSHLCGGESNASIVLSLL
jgi:hypothetical protein